VTTTGEFLASVRARAGLAETNGLLSAAEIIDLAMQVWDTDIAELLRVAGNYGVKIASDAAIVSGTATYAFPADSQGAGALAIWYVDGDIVLPMAEIPVSQSHMLYNSQRFASPDDAPYAYTFEGNSIRLLPTPATTRGHVRIVYFERPTALDAEELDDEIPLPREAVAALVAGTVRDVCEVLGDAQKQAIAERTYNRELARLRTLFRPRVRKSEQVVVNRYSPLRGRRYR
jgi:hypothetical protein